MRVYSVHGSSSLSYVNKGYSAVDEGWGIKASRIECVTHHSEEIVTYF